MELLNMTFEELTDELKKGSDRYAEANTMITLSPNKDYGEIVFYKHTFTIPIELADSDSVNRLRTWVKDSDGFYVAQKPVDLIKQDLMLRKCGKRATNKIMLYAMANRWEQFITLTFDPNMINRYDDFEAKEKWREFQRYCKYHFPDCKLLAVWEYHEKEDEYGARALHFHVLASGLRFQTIPFLDRNGVQRKSSSGAPLYILSPKDWPYGFSTLAYLPEDGQDNQRVANYLTKYVSKTRAGNKMSKEVGNYNAKRYFATRNLDICFSSCMDRVWSLKAVSEFARENGFELFKDNEKLLVFRKYGTGHKDTSVRKSQLLRINRAIFHINKIVIPNPDLKLNMRVFCFKTCNCYVRYKDVAVRKNLDNPRRFCYNLFDGQLLSDKRRKKFAENRRRAVRTAGVRRTVHYRNRAEDVCAHAAELCARHPRIFYLSFEIQTVRQAAARNHTVRHRKYQPL